MRISDWSSDVCSSDRRISPALSVDEQSNYLDYMEASGSLFLLGEHSGFAARNQSVIDVIAAAGGGDVPLPAGSIGTQYVTATFNGANLIVADLNTGFFVPAAGTVTSPGTGIFFTTSESNGGDRKSTRLNSSH